MDTNETINRWLASNRGMRYVKAQTRLFERGQAVYYLDSQTNKQRKATIALIGPSMADGMPSGYTLMFEDGTERNTEAARLLAA